MEFCKIQNRVDHLSSQNLKIIRHPIFQPKSSAWLDLRVFYVRISNVEVDDSTPVNLTLNRIPLWPETILEVNGGRSRAHSECVTSQLRRDRFDKRSEEATFVNTDSIKMTGSVIFDVCDGDDLLLSGMLELCESNGFVGGKAKSQGKIWKIQCQSHISSTTRSLLKTKKYSSPEILLPTVEVYVAGRFMGNPIILTKTLHLGSPPKKVQRKVALDSIPEYDSPELTKDALLDDSEMFEYTYHRQPDCDDHCCNNSSYQMADYVEDEDGELSWFNAGVRVGVGLSLGICVGVSLGVGLLIRTYQATSRNFKRRLF